jgi:hypothetical protein
MNTFGAKGPFGSTLASPADPGGLKWNPRTRPPPSAMPDSRKKSLPILNISFISSDLFFLAGPVNPETAH